MSKPRKFNFIPGSQFGLVPKAAAEDAPTISISKMGQIRISKAAVRQYNLEGQLVDIMWDPSTRAFGLRKMAGQPIDGMSSSMRILKTDKKYDIMMFGIGRLMTKFGIEKANYPRLEVDKYVTPLVEGEILYVIVPKPEKSNEKTA